MCDFEDPAEPELLMFVSKVFQYFDNKDAFDEEDDDGCKYLIIQDDYSYVKEDGEYWHKLLKEKIYQEELRKPVPIKSAEKITEILDEIVKSLASVGSFHLRWFFFEYAVKNLPVYANRSIVFIENGFNPEWLAKEELACLTFFSYETESFNDGQVTRDFILKWYAKEVKKLYPAHLLEISRFHGNANPKSAGCCSALTYLGITDHSYIL